MNNTETYYLSFPCFRRFDFHPNWYMLPPARQAAARRRRRRDARHVRRVQVDPRDGLEPAVGVADALDQRVPLLGRPLLILIRGGSRRPAF